MDLLSRLLATYRRRRKPKITQVDPVLCEDNQTVLLHGYDRDDNLFIQSFTLPAAISEDEFVPGDWKDNAIAGKWRPIP